MKSFETSNLERDIDKVRHISSFVKKRLLDSDPNYRQKIDILSDEELGDLDQILGITEQLLLKYRHKKDTHSLLKEFVDMIKAWSYPFEEINDDVRELIISAQSSVSEIKTAQNDVTLSLSFDEQKKHVEIHAAKNGTINLTKSATPVYTQGYLQNHQAQYEQVV